MGGKKTVEKNREWEKGRRDKLNQSFCELSKLLPDHDPSITLSKMEILNRAAMYIKTLQRQNQDILNDGKQTYLDDEVDRLQKRVAHLVFKTKLLVDALRNAGVPIPEVKPPKTRNRKKPESKSSPCLNRESNHSNVMEEKSRILEEPTVSDDVVILTDEALKDVMKTSTHCTSNSLKALEESLKLTEAANIIPESLSKPKDLIKITKEPLKEINSTLPSVNIPKDISSITQASQNPPISVEVKEQPIIAGSLPGVITSLGQGQSSSVTNFTFLERSLVNLGPGTLILADGRVVNVPPPIPQIVVKPQPTLILMQKSVRREKRLYPKPKQVDVTRTTFSNKAPIPTIKHFNFEFKTKRSRIKVTKTRLSPKQIKKKEPAKSKVKAGMTKIDGEVQVEISKTLTTVTSNNSGCSTDLEEKDQNETDQNKTDNMTGTNSNLCPTPQEEKEIESLSKEDNIKTDSLNYSQVEVNQASDSNLPTPNSQNIVTEDLTSINNNTGEKLIKNDYVTSQLKDLEQTVPFENTDKITENCVDTEKECPAIENVEVSPLTPENSVNSMSTVVDSCIDPNRSFESEINVDSGDSFKNKDVNKSTIKPVVTHSRNVVNNGTVEMDNSNPTNQRPVQIIENTSVVLEVDQIQLSKNKSLLNQNIQGVQNTSTLPTSVDNTTTLKEPLNSFKTPQISQCSENNSIQNRSNKTTNPFPSNVDASYNSVTYSDSSKQYQQLSTVNHKVVQNKTNQNSNKHLETQTCKQIQNESILNTENGYYNSRVSDKPNKEFYGSQQRVDERCQVESYGNQHNGNIHKIPYNPDKSHNVIPIEPFNQTVVANKDGYNKEKRMFEANNQNMSKDAYVLSHNVSGSALNKQPFVDLNKQPYPSQSCSIPRTVAYTDNCNLMKDSFNVAEKPPNKEIFSNYIGNAMDKSSYLEQTNSSLSKDSYGNQYSMKHYFNQGGSINHQSLYMNQYNSSYSFMNSNSGVYGKDSFITPCESFNFANPENPNKDYSGRNIQSQKDLYSNSQNNPLNKTGYVSQNSSLNKTYQNQTGLISKDCSNNKETYREQSISLTNQCGVLNNDNYGTNKECYAAQNSNQTLCNSLNKDNYHADKNLESRQTISVKDSSNNANSTPRSTVNKSTFVANQKTVTVDKACQPEMPLCRNITNAEFMEVVNQNVMRRNQKDSEDIQQLRSVENGRNESLRNPRCTNNSLYSTNQPIYTFSSMPEHSGLPFDGNVPKRKETVYNNKNSSSMVCKYTIDSLFKNGAQVNIASERDKVVDNGPPCKNHVLKKSTGPYEIDGLPIVNEPNLNQNQIYQNESNHFAIPNREQQNICDNSTRNEIDLADTGCNITQQTDIHNNTSCKTSSNSTDKNGQSNKMFNNDGGFNKNDSILISSADLMKAKDLDRNNYMPLLDDVRLTTDFSNDLFSSFQVAPGGQHPESMSPTAAFLLAFPLVSTSKVADSINENDNPEHNSSTPTTILQIGNIDQPNADMFNAQVDSLRSKPVDDSNKDYERYSNYDGNVYENVQVESSKRKQTNQNFTEQTNNCAEKNFRRTNENKKRSRNQPEMSSYSQAYSYPIFPGNDFTQFTNPSGDPKADGLTVPWSMNLNQDFQTQTVQKDACTSTNKQVKNTDKKISKTEKQTQKNTNYSCSQQSSQTVDYYVSKPERKKQKTSHSKTPVNWMAPVEPSKNSFTEPPLPQIDVYQNNKEQENNQTQNIYNNIVSSLEVPFDSVCFSDFGNKKSNNYSWSPSKSLLPSLDNHNFVIPSTLPTLVGDLALGTSTPAETFKCFEDNRKFEQPKKADKSSSTFLDNAGIAQGNSSSVNNKKRVDYSSKTQANNSFLSVSQLVDPKSQKQNKINEIKNTKRNETAPTKDKFQACQNISTRREQQEQNCIYNHRNEMPNSCWNDKQQKIPYKGNYSAESLIAAQPTSDTSESFHLNFNNYQAQSNYFHGDFTEGNQAQQGQQYQNYFNQGANHFPTFLGEEYNQEFPSGSQRKKKNKEASSIYPTGIQAKDSFTPLHKDNSGYINTLQKDTGNYQAAGLLSQGYRNCIKIGVPQAGQHSNTTSTLTNFNLSTIFPEMNDQRVSGGSSQPPHINPNFTSLPLHSYPPH